MLARPIDRQMPHVAAYILGIAVHFVGSSAVTDTPASDLGDKTRQQSHRRGRALPSTQNEATRAAPQQGTAVSDSAVV
jgi:hypothetical protein